MPSPDSAPSDLTYRRSRWLKGSLWLGIANAASLGATLIVGVLLARKLGPSGLGVYAAVTVATTFMSLLVTFRLELHLLTLLRNDETDRAAYFSVLRASYLLALPICLLGEAIALLVIHGAPTIWTPSRTSTGSGLVKTTTFGGTERRKVGERYTVAASSGS